MNAVLVRHRMPIEGTRAFEDVTIIRDDGTRGKVLDKVVSGDHVTRLMLEFEDGARVIVPSQDLIAEEDGTYRLHVVTGATASSADDVVIPVVTEKIEVTTDRVARGKVQLHKRVETHDEVVDTPTVREEVFVERVPANTLVQGEVPQVREEDGVLLIPVLEEVVVVEKGLLLRETVRITKRRTSTTDKQTVTLRRDVVDIERVEPDSPAS
jgi:uncharacterized protein (TIGR02271 family)